MENAKIYAENVIRNRKEALNLKRFSVKMSAIAAKLEAAARTQQVSPFHCKLISAINSTILISD